MICEQALIMSNNDQMAAEKELAAMIKWLQKRN